MEPPVLAAKIEQRVAVRLELRAHHSPDEDKMVARFMQRLALTFERNE